MTSIHIVAKKPTGTGLQPMAGTFRFAAVRRYFDDAKNLVVPANFEAQLANDGTLSVDLLPTDDRFVWKIVEFPGTSASYTRYVEVPDTQSTIEYADLVDVDPATFVPVAMIGGDLLRVHHAASQADAEEYSTKHPDVFVFFDEAASSASASEALASIASLAEEARTNLRMVRAASDQVVTDAATVGTIHTSIESTAAHVASTASEATDRIQQAVAQVEAAADAATGANRPATIPEV